MSLSDAELDAKCVEAFSSDMQLGSLFAPTMDAADSSTLVYLIRSRGFDTRSRFLRHLGRIVADAGGYSGERIEAGHVWFFATPRHIAEAALATVEEMQNG